MTVQTLPLTTFYSGWAGYQRGLVEIIAPLSPEQLALPASSHHWSMGMIAQHILSDRVWWFQLWMGQGSPDLAPIIHWNPGDEEGLPVRSASELAAGLEATWHMIADALARWTPADLGHVYQPPASLSEEEQKSFGELTRQWIIWHVLEHEIHHAGELSLALGNYGLKGVYGDR
ncbi:MAG: DinB family protein [Ktedonobacteraceae bacterium]